MAAKLKAFQIVVGILRCVSSCMVGCFIIFFFHMVMKHSAMSS